MGKSNWDKIREQDPMDSVRYRDVYEDQQLDRSSMSKKQSPLSRAIITAVVSFLAAALVYVIASLVIYGFTSIKASVGGAGGGSSGMGSGATINYYDSFYRDGHRVYQARDENGGMYGPEYDKKSDVPVPDWYKEYEAAQRKAEADAKGSVSKDGSVSFGSCLFPRFGNVLPALIAGLLVAGIMWPFMLRDLYTQNSMADPSDINQYHNDQHIALPEEIMRKFDFFPDVGAHSNVQPSSMISHIMLKNKGLMQVAFALRHKKDVLDEDGEVEYYEGEVVTDDDGNVKTELVPVIDTKFSEALFDASDALDDKRVRKYYDATAIPYNPDNKNRDKLKGFDTLADLINKDWVIPEYEPQRPAGVYVVDTAPVNTMVLAITRAGKGQTIIEPTLDMWSRELRPNNIVVNDPKGELLRSYYVRGTVRGFQIVQFNLINALKTDIYNPLGLAACAAREGDFTKCALYVENIADVFFPLDGAEDPVWPNAANNAFKRAAYGLIDYYLEEEKALRQAAALSGMADRVLERHVDEMWGKVTLYNCYQLFVQLTSRKKKAPYLEFVKQIDTLNKMGVFAPDVSPEQKEQLISSLDPEMQELARMPDDEYNALLAEKKAEFEDLYESKPELDLLTLFFNATDLLPRNSMRVLVGNANNALRSMAGAEKMMASVYGIAITAMSFFTDPTISTLTSGTLSQNADLAGLSFPRRLAVRFDSDYIKRYHLIGMQCLWESFEDADFTKSLGKKFYHEDLVTREGWAKYYFEGIYPFDTAYAKLSIKNPQTGLLIKTFHFKFTKSYQVSLDGRRYKKDPVLDERIVKNGIITELTKFRDRKTGRIVFAPGHTQFEVDRVTDLFGGDGPKKVKTNAIIQTDVRYSEKPKMVFLVTPPHLMKYAKLILILIKQLVDLNFDQSYMTKSNQKP